MGKLVEFGYGLKLKKQSKEELNEKLTLLPEDIIEKFHKFETFGEILYETDKKDINSIYNICLFSDEDNVIKQTDNDGTPYYLITNNKKVLNDLVSLRIKAFSCDERYREVDQNRIKPIVCSFSNLIAALETMGYYVDGFTFDDVEYFFNEFNECSLSLTRKKYDKEYKKDTARIRIN